MPIIVEGPDGSGKTTLIERLGFNRKHLKALRSGTGSEGTGNWGGNDPAIVAYAKQILFGHPATAFDRFYLSETIYGPILRGESAIRPEEVRVLQRVIRGLKVPQVICLPSWETTFANVTREGRERPAYQTDDFLLKSYQGFQAAAAKPTEHIVWDFTRDPLPALAPHCAVSFPPDVLGHPMARVLLVGTPTEGLPWPALSMDGGDGPLNVGLWYAGFAERDMAFAPVSMDIQAAITSSTQLVIAIDSSSHARCMGLGLDMGVGVTYATTYRDALRGTMAAKLLELRGSLR
jgi:hypothetical protein